MLHYFWKVYNACWKTPLRILYFGGPALAGYGFWANRAAHDICADLTTVSAEHWMKHNGTCAELLEAHFGAFHIGVTSAVYFGCILAAIVLGMSHIIIVRPVVRSIQSLKRA